MKKSVSFASVTIFVVLAWLVNILPVTGEVADSISYPVNGSITLDFGGTRKHLGEDQCASVNDSVYAPCNATIFDSGFHAGYGGAVVAQFIRPDGTQDVWLVGHMFASTLRGVGPVRKGELIGKVANRANNGNWAPHIHFAIRKGPHPGSWVYPGYAGTYGQTMANFYDPDVYISNYPSGSGGGGSGGGSGGGGTTPPPGDGDPASLEECIITNRGEGYWVIGINSKDFSGRAGGVRSIRVILRVQFRTPPKEIDLGKHFSPGNPQHWGSDFNFDVLTSLDPGNYQVFIETESGDGRIKVEMAHDSVLLNKSGRAPIRIDDHMTTDSNGKTIYWLKVGAEHGQRFVKYQDLWIQAGNRMISLGRARGSEHTWIIDGKGLGLAPGRYPLFYYFEDVWGTKSEPFVPSNRWIDVAGAS